MQKRRVVVTGLGTVNPLANDVKGTWDKILSGKSGIGPVTHFDTSTYTCQVAGEVRDFDYTKYFREGTVSKARKMDPYIHYACAASKEALEMSGFDLSQNPDRVGVCVGTGIGGIHTQQNNSKILFEKGHRRVSPFYIPGFIGNTASGFLSMEFGIEGPNFSMQTACATGNHSIGTAFLIIQAGMADAMLAGGAEASILDIAFAGFCNMRALSTKYNDSPETASRPFDIDRDGFVMAEGSGVLFLEEYESAKKRGADIICEVMSIGMTGDAHDLVMPHPEGVGAHKSMKMAVDNAGISSTDIDYINAHGTSTPLGDIAESKAILKLLEGKQDNVNVGSSKSMTGHLLGATAGVEAIISAMAIKDNKIPPTINVFNQDPKVELSCINTETIEKDVNVAISNSFGFGGHNSTLCLKKVD